MSSPRVLEACQEESISRGQWLEQELVGPSLGVLVGELMVLAGPAAAAERQFTAAQAADWLGRDCGGVLSAGLGALPKEKLDELFRRPAILGGLQELVLVEGSEHWDGLVGRSDVFKATAAFHRRQIAQRLGFADQPDPPTGTGRIVLPAAAPAVAPVAAGRSWWPAALFAVTGLAAAWLAAVILPQRMADRAAGPSGAGDQPGAVADAELPKESPAEPAPPGPPVVAPEPTVIVKVETPEPAAQPPIPTSPPVPSVPQTAPAPPPPAVAVDTVGPVPSERMLQAVVVVPPHPWVALLAAPGAEPFSAQALAELSAESRAWSRTVAAAEQVSVGDIAAAVGEVQRATNALSQVLAGPRAARMAPAWRDELTQACRRAEAECRAIGLAAGAEGGDLGKARRRLLDALDAIERSIEQPAAQPAPEPF